MPIRTISGWPTYHTAIGDVAEQRAVYRKDPSVVVTPEIHRGSQTPPEQGFQHQVDRVEHGGEGDQEPARRERGLGGDAYPEGCDEGWFALRHGLLGEPSLAQGADGALPEGRICPS